MIKEAYCSFEVAKLLKEKGFNELARFYYFEPRQSPEMFPSQREHRNTDKIYGENTLIAPTHQMAMRWLREVHNIIIEPESVWNGKEWEYLLFVVTPQNADSPYYEHNPYKSYEECVEAALKYVLKNLI